MKHNRFLKLFIYYIAFTWLWSFGKSVLPPIIAGRGFNLPQMMLATLFMIVAQGFFLITIKKYQSKIFWLLSAFILLFYIICVSLLKINTFQFYLISFISGFATPLFYVCYNFSHFNLSSKEKRGESSALMFGAPIIITILAPLFAGFLFQESEIWFWLFLVISLGVILYLLKFQEPIILEYSIRKTLTEIKATRVLILLSGIWDAMIFGVIPIYTLFFIKTPLGYGQFLAYISLVSFIATYLLGKISDKMQKKAIFIFILAPAMALFTFLFPLATENVLLWVILTGIIFFLLPLFWSVSTALIIDSQSDLKLTILGREIMLNIGRIIGLLASFLSFQFEGKPFFLFIFLGSAMLLLPLTLLYNSRISKKYFYA